MLIETVFTIVGLSAAVFGLFLSITFMMARNWTFFFDGLAIIFLGLGMATNISMLTIIGLAFLILFFIASLLRGDV